MSYMGPVVLGILARAATDPRAREDALAEGEALLRARSVSHNYLLFPRDAIDACLEAGDWDRADRYAAWLEDYARREPMPSTDFAVARGRALAAWGQIGRAHI